MINISKGRYWDKPWSLISSCTRCSPGCQNCWSLAMEKRFHKGIEGKVEVHPDRLSIPLKRRKPTVFSIWNDLFHEAVPDSSRDQAYAAMALSSQHTFLILTKRAKKMLEWFSYDASFRTRADRVSEACGDHFNLDYDVDDPTETWPLANVWHGITICNQAEADANIPIFLQVPGKKFLSIEPMLGPVKHLDSWPFYREIRAVILGGETGPGARPMHPDWVRSVRNQCQSAGVDFFFKSWGKHIPIQDHVPFNPKRELDGHTYDDLPWGCS